MNGPSDYSGGGGGGGLTSDSKWGGLKTLFLKVGGGVTIIFKRQGGGQSPSVDCQVWLFTIIVN